MAHDIADNGDRPEGDKFEKLIAPQASPWTYEVVYKNLLVFGYGHIAALYGAYLAVTTASLTTLVFQFILLFFAGIGVTAGAHRLWAHRSYKAKTPLQILLMLMNCIAFQNTAIDWVRDHRMHHRYSDTDADPYNSARGFFFSHVGWLLVRKHPELKRRKGFINIDDVKANPVLRFQKKYAIPLIGSICFVLPTVIPVIFWGENLNTAWHMTIFRYVTTLNVTFLVNSAAHMWGYKTYDEDMKATQNLIVSYMTFGEGFHNYHHVYPWDYKTAELGNNYLNLTTKCIDFFAWIGWAYDLKTVPENMVKSRAKKTGDGTNCWGL